MIRYIVVSIGSGILFGVLDGVINGNPYAQKLFEVYKPVSKTSINIPAGVVIDLFYGFILAGIFLLLYSSLPGSRGVVKGISFAIIIWFLRVVMHTVTQWMTLKVPVTTLIYIVITGLIEMVILGILYGFTLEP